jgi:PKD repeat protein
MQRPLLVLVCLGIAGSIGSPLLLGPAAAQSNENYACVYYAGPAAIDPAMQARVVERYQWAITGLDIGQNAIDLKQRKPSFGLYVYNTLTDNGYGELEDQLIAARCADAGIDPEICYYHYSDSTVVSQGSVTRHLPAGHRAGLYVNFEPLRCAVNFNDPTAREIMLQVALDRSVRTTFIGTDLHPDGIFGDNSAVSLFNVGNISLGGHVAEVAGNPLIGSPAFQEYHWSGFRQFLTALRDSLESYGATLVINTTNTWSDDYAHYHVADALFMEFIPDPVRSFGMGMPGTMWQRETLAAEHGVQLWYAPSPKRDDPGFDGELTYGQALLGGLAWFLTTRTENSWHFAFGTGAPYYAGYDTLNWRGCMDVDLGEPTAPPYVISSGTDPLGNPFEVWARPYTGGLSLTRARGAWNQGIEVETAVDVPLPRPLAPVSPEGEIGAPVASVSLRNGTGAILLGNPGDPTGDPPVADFLGAPTSGLAPLTVSFTDQSMNSPTAWTWDFGDGAVSVAQHPSHTYDSPGVYTVTLTVANASGTDSETKVDYVTVDAVSVPPEAQFTGTPTSGTAPLTVNFTDQSTNDPEAWSWSFGDGGTATARHPSHTYESPGTYTVTLTATNAAGSDSETKVGYITVSAETLPPEAQFTGTPTSGNAPLAVSFTDQTTNGPTAWSWTFGDGATSSGQHPRHTYGSPGTYSVTLTATNSAGSDSETKVGYITVGTAPGLPEVHFTAAPTTGTAPLTVEFTDESTGSPVAWWWNFGDGETSTAQHPTHTYTSQGSYTVVLRVVNSHGAAEHRETDFIVVADPLLPVADFSGNPREGSAPLEVDFTDESAGNPTAWNWDFGNGVISNKQDPSHTYQSPGTYNVTLTVTNANGSDSETKVGYIVVGAMAAPPEARFSGVPTSGIAPRLVSFTDQSTNNPTAWSWDFGDGAASTTQHPAHTYVSPGTYTVTLTATNAFGADSETKYDYITISAPPPPVAPTAFFSGSPREGTAPLRVSFTDQSAGEPTAWSWDFGDGSSSSAQNPSHTYAYVGEYEITLRVSNDVGADTLTLTDYVVVNEAPPPVAPTADFSGSPREGIAPLAVSFTDQSTGDPASWSWSFGDGWTSTVQNPSHTYAAAGDYEVTLTVANAFGSDTRTKTEYITVAEPPPPPPPTAAFSGDPVAGTAPLMVNFTDESANDPTYWMWSFGDGITSAVQHPNHTYATPGSYTVTLMVANATGADSETKVGYITVGEALPPVVPKAGFSGSPRQGDAPLTVSFTDQSTDGPTGWSWSFGDGATSDNQHPSHTYESPGTYAVTLTASNAAGSDGETKVGYIIVSAPPPPVVPTAGFSGSPTEGTAPLTVGFTDQSTESPTAWSWDFGDGGTSNARHPSHTYESAGTYTVTLTASNAAGSDTQMRVDYIAVSVPTVAPDAQFTGAPTSGTAPLTVSFTDQSTNNPTAWSWDFGDGGTSDARHPSHTFESPGLYTVTLTASNAAGSRGRSRVHYISVTEETAPPEAQFTGAPTSGTTPLAVTFMDQSTNNPTAWSWDFGDGATSTEQHPSHTYESPGSYSVTLTATNSAGSDSETKAEYIAVSAVTLPPETDFAGTPTSGGAPLTVSFTDHSTNSPTAWSWNFGDGWSSAAQHPNHTFASPGTYTVRLTATNAAGSDTETKADYVIVAVPTPPPQADFSADPTEDAAPLAVDFTDLSTNEPTAWSWSFGDGNESTEQHPSHTYETPGSYTVTLTVSNAGGEDTETKTDYITATPPPSLPETGTADFGATPTVGPAPLRVSFTDLSTNEPTDWLWEFGDGSTATAQHPSHTYETPGLYTVVLTVSTLSKSDVETKLHYIEVLPGEGPGLAVAQNMPSPLTPRQTSISYSIPQDGHVRLELLSADGRCVGILADEYRSAGPHAANWRPTELPTGHYFMRLICEDQVEVKSILLIK